MRIGVVLTPPSDLHFRWAAQVGVTDFVSRYHGIDSFEGLQQVQARAAGFGLNLSVVEGYLPTQEIIRGTAGRDGQIEEMVRLVQNMGKLGIPLLCYNFMPNDDWTRTSFQHPERGGAISNSFDLSLLAQREVAPEKRISQAQLWENLEYFLKRIVPVAEEAGVKVSMHPDDPPLPELLGSGQIMFQPESFERLVKLYPSPSNGICFCQGTFAEMGVDIPATIRRLGPWINYVHFRDVNGSVPQFQESFHDNGKTNMYEAMRTYREVGFDGAMRPDHVPKLEGEEGDGSGYSMLGRLFAVGYMRGLMHAVDTEYPAAT